MTGNRLLQLPGVTTNDLWEFRIGMNFIYNRGFTLQH